MVSKLKYYRRKSANREPRKTFLIVTEGATEEQYFKKFRRQPGPIVLVKDGKDSKRSLVESAIAERELRVKNQDYLPEVDETWVVMDRDIDMGNKHDLDNFNQALQLADNENINVAWSNDAFELWLLLHFQDVEASMHRTQLNELLSKHIGKKYEKAKGDEMFDATKDFRDDAIRRSERMLKDMETIHPSSANPCTTVHLLVVRLVTHPGFRE